MYAVAYVLHNIASYSENTGKGEKGEGRREGTLDMFQKEGRMSIGGIGGCLIDLDPMLDSSAETTRGDRLPARAQNE